MDELDLLIDLHVNNDRQGPGSDRDAQIAFDLALSDGRPAKRIADMGCGCGASSLFLARKLADSARPKSERPKIVSIDMIPAFVEALRSRANANGVADLIEARVGDMNQPDLPENSIDLIWCEAAIYNIGFREGLQRWKSLLRPGGALVVSDLTWTTEKRPQQIEEHWRSEYPGITTQASNLMTLESEGYRPIGSFFVSQDSWMANYYEPLEEGFDDFLNRHERDGLAQKIVENERKEIDLYREYGRWYGYCFFIAQSPTRD